jgi:uracil-DNA glycosylase family 4
MNVKRIFDEAQHCTRCYGDTPIYVPYPDPKNAANAARIMFLNERPGRIGTGESGYVSFDNDDPSANFFKECFYQLGIDRKEIFISNACICHPLYPDYRDASPRKRELRNCHYWLKKELDIVQPKLLVTIGSKALDSLKLFFSSSRKVREFQLKYDIGEVIKDTEPWIYPLYHTSRRGRTHRRAEQQRMDWMLIPQILTQLED